MIELSQSVLNGLGRLCVAKRQKELILPKIGPAIIMNPVVKAQLSEFSKTNPITGFEEQDYFEVYSIHSCLNGDLNYSVDPFDGHLKGSEFGLDGLAILVQGNLCDDSDEVAAALERNSSVDLVFFQSKRSEKFEYGDISKFIDGVCGFFEGTMDGESEQLDDLIAAQKGIYEYPLRKNPSIRCMYISTGAYEPVDRIEKLLELGRSRLKGMNLFDEIVVELVDARRLQAGYRLATNSNSATIEFSKSQTLPLHQSVEEAYMGYISAEELLNLATVGAHSEGNVRMNQSVFFDNIRDFNPKSGINKSIADQLDSGDTSSFVFKNNGVTVVAKSINRKRDLFTIENYQIVNGCQTCNILFTCRDKIENVNVPLRLIASTDEEFVSSIIIGTNKQNEVKEEQFWALRPFMKNLEEYCKQQPADGMVFLERRENQYREQSVERTRIVKTSDLLKCVVAMFLYYPNRAARDWRGIRADFENEIFQEDHDVEPYHLACLGNYKFNFIVRNKRVNQSWKIYKFYSLYALGLKACKGRKLFDISKKELKQACREVSAVISDENAFVNHVTEVATLIDSLLASRNLETREQIRDMLRTEAFGTDFKENYKDLIGI